MKFYEVVKDEYDFVRFEGFSNNLEAAKISCGIYLAGLQAGGPDDILNGWDWDEKRQHYVIERGRYRCYIEVVDKEPTE